MLTETQTLVQLFLKSPGDSSPSPAGTSSGYPGLGGVVGGSQPCPALIGGSRNRCPIFPPHPRPGGTPESPHTAHGWLLSKHKAVTAPVPPSPALCPLPSALKGLQAGDPAASRGPHNTGISFLGFWVTAEGSLGSCPAHRALNGRGRECVPNTRHHVQQADIRASGGAARQARDRVHSEHRRDRSLSGQHFVTRARTSGVHSAGRGKGALAQAP